MLSTTLTDQVYTAGETITGLILPAATGGTPPYFYALTGDLPDGLSFNNDANTRILSGTPATATMATTMTYTVTDSATPPMSNTNTFQITIQMADSMPTPPDPPPPTPPPSSCPSGSGPLAPTETAYSLTFTASWTATSHPTNFPSNSNPHFTTLVGAVHDDANVFWAPNELASDGIELVAELGSTPTLVGEINGADPATPYTGSNIFNTNGGIARIDFRVSPACPLVSFVSMVAPSHDWFVGVHGLDLRNADGQFVDKTMNLRVYDAGTEDGNDFSLSGAETSPQGLIALLTTPAAATDFASGVHRITGAFVGQFAFEVTTPATEQMQLTAAPATIAADGGVSTVTLTRPRAESSGEMVVDLQFGGNAVRGVDYRASATRVRMAPGATRASLKVTATMGSHSQPDKNLTITAGARTVALVLGTAANINAEINRAILPQAARAVAAQGMAAVGERIRQAHLPPRPRVTFGGQSTWSGVARTHGQSLGEGDADWKTILSGSAFVLPIRDGAVGGALNGITVWGGGDYRNLEGSGALDWDGGLLSTHLGADVRLRDGLLAGLAVFHSAGNFKYRFGGIRGEHELRLTGVRPYLGWKPDETRDGWATVGYGRGEVRILGDGGRYSSDAVLQSVGAGGSLRAWRGDAAELRLKGDAALTRLSVARDIDIPSLKVAVRRVRLLLEGSRKIDLAGGAQFAPRVEFGWRHDGGDGGADDGVELGGGLRYTRERLILEGNARALLGYDDYREWGVSAAVRIAPGAHGQGWSFTAQPAYGDPVGDPQALWDHHGNHGNHGAAHEYSAQMRVALGYGIPVALGLLTPYTEFTGGKATRDYRLGMKWRHSAFFDIHFFREHRRNPDKNAFLLEGIAHF